MAEAISPPGGSKPAVHIDARGRALAVWLQGSELWYAWREPRGRFSRPRPMGAASVPVNNPDDAVALSANGVATAAYRAASGRIEVRRAPPGREFGPPVAVSDPAAATSPPTVATDDEARAVLTWHEEEDPERRVMAAFVSARGAVSTPALVGRGQFPTVAMNPAGAAVIAWMDHQGRPTAAVRPPAGQFPPPTTLALPPADPLAAIDVAGRAVAAGTDLRHPPPEGQRPGSSFAVADAAGVFGPAHRLDHDGHLAQVLAEPDGSVGFISWYGTGSTFVSRRADGTLIGPTPLSPAGTCDPRASVSRGGTLLATWMGSCDVYTPRNRPHVRMRDRLGRFGEPESIGELSAMTIRGAITDGDEAIVVYEHGNSRTIHAVAREDRRDAPLPPVPDIDLDVPDELYLPDLDDVELPARCRRACSLTPVALLHAGGRTLSGAQARPRRLRAGRRARLAVPLSADARQAAQEAAAAEEPVWMSVSVTVKGRSPRPQTVTRRIAVRAP